MLINEFRDELSIEPPSTLQIVPLAETPEQRALVRQVAQAFRAKDAEKYMTMADEIEKEFNLGKLVIAPEHLGRVDTFRFEEKVLLSRARSLIARGEYVSAPRSLPTGSAASGSTATLDVSFSGLRARRW